MEATTTSVRRKLLIATANVSKCREILEILEAADLPIELVTLAGYPEMPETEETGETFGENARIKAEAAARYTGLPTLADDGGLVIDALGGAPGIRSRRFLGEATPFSEKMARILEMMQDVPDDRRACRFQCAVAIVLPDGPSFECLGTCEGQVAHELRGAYGFGYDPIVLLPELNRHVGELPPAEKHRISHRGKALSCAVAALSSLFPNEH